MYQTRSYVTVATRERALRAVIAKWYAVHAADRPRPTLAKQPAPSLACRAVRVACYAQFLRVVEA